MLNGINLDASAIHDIFHQGDYETVRRIAIPAMAYVSFVEGMSHDAAQEVRESFTEVLEKTNGAKLLEDLREFFFETAKLVESQELHPDSGLLTKINAIINIAMLVNRGLNLMLNAVLNVEQSVDKVVKLERLMGYHGKALEFTDMTMSLIVSSQLLTRWDKAVLTNPIDEEPEPDLKPEPEPEPEPEPDLDGIIRAIRSAGGTVVESEDNKEVLLQFSRNLFHRLVAIDRFEIPNVTARGNGLGELSLESKDHGVKVIISDDQVKIHIHHRGN